MNDRQRILALLEGGVPDRVPWLGDLTYWAGAMARRGEVAPDFQQSDAYFQFHRELRVGFYLQGYFPFQTHYDPTIEVRTWAEGDDHYRSLRTPLGTLREKWTWLPESFAGAPTEHLVKSADDLPILRHIYERTSYTADYALAECRRAKVADLGIVLVYTPRTPFMQLVAMEAGIETLALLAATAPDDLVATLGIMEAKHDEAVTLAVASPAECVMIPENLSSEMVGRRLFETHMRRCQEKWVGRIRAAGKHSFIHIDGTLRGLLREEGAVGFNVLEALTPAPVGDLPVGEWRALAGPGPILWGGLPGVYFTPLVSDEEFDRHTIEVLEVMRRDRRCVLGVADQVPPDALRERVRRVADLADRYGRYS
ncbi:MAG: hypothetical protein M1457_11455 [bacterium]|nr:hypothetical protein [bacterium]